MIALYKKYIIIAFIGAAVIGLAAYLFLSNFLERVPVPVLSRDVEKGQVLSEDDLGLREYYKNVLPQDVLMHQHEMIGKPISLERKQGDFLRPDMFEEKESIDILDRIGPGESIIAVHVHADEKIVRELKRGDRFTIVSAEKDPELADSIFGRPSVMANDEAHPQAGGTYGSPMRDKDYIKEHTFQLSENVMLVAGQVMISGLEVIDIHEETQKGSNILISGSEERFCLYIKCLLAEAPMLSKVLAKNNYKILLGH